MPKTTARFITLLLLLMSSLSFAGHFYDRAEFMQSASSDEQEMAKYYTELFTDAQKRNLYRGILVIDKNVSHPLSPSTKEKLIEQYQLNNTTQLGGVLVLVNPAQKKLEFITTGIIDQKRKQDPNFFDAPKEKFAKDPQIKMGMVLYFIGLMHLYLTGEYP